MKHLPWILLAGCVGTFCRNDAGEYDWVASQNERFRPTQEAYDRKIQAEAVEAAEDLSDSLRRAEHGARVDSEIDRFRESREAIGNVEIHAEETNSWLLNK